MSKETVTTSHKYIKHHARREKAIRVWLNVICGSDHAKRENACIQRMIELENHIGFIP